MRPVSGGSRWPSLSTFSGNGSCKDGLRLERRHAFSAGPEKDSFLVPPAALRRCRRGRPAGLRQSFC
ncbi:hypothetical protein DESPIG_02685 [Desulfovibrio piger ATCC 29098]|uniref:Uncharacterized protein n=1 Tax=Desulfovibrio piger ATCC 29098 TaxID=411464 RepID=B6WX59_9BACT|nr:hypothetical protein DESPIG_02685 [Desulfovibrio piger ATCC 29098]